MLRDMSDARPRILLADDHAMLLEAFARLLEPECEVVGKVTTGAALVDAARRLMPDIIVTDMTMPGMSGIDAARTVLARQPDVRVILLTMHDDPALAAEAFRVGVSGFLLKSSAGSELLEAVRNALRDEAYLTPLVADGDLTRLADLAPASCPLEKLSSREREVLQLLAEGMGMKQVGAELGITPRTVAFHKYRLMKTIGASTNADLVQFAVRFHLVAQP